MTPKMTGDAEKAMATMMDWLAPILREPTAQRINWVLESLMADRTIKEADKILLVEAARFVMPSNYEVRFGKMLGTAQSTKDAMKPIYSDLKSYFTFPRLVKRVSIDALPPTKPASQMKVLAFTSGTRKDGNSDILTAEALRGAEDAGASIEVIRLSELPIGRCFSTLLNESYTELKHMYPGREFKYCEYAVDRTDLDHKGYCAIGDKMPETFKKIEQADAILFSFPIYTDWETSLIANFYERWIRYEFCMGTIPKLVRRGMVIATWGSLNTRVYEDIIDHVIENLYLRKIDVVETLTNCGLVGMYSGLDENYHGIANHFPKMMEMTYLAGRSLVTGERNQPETVVEVRDPGRMQPVKIIPGRPPVAD